MASDKKFTAQWKKFDKTNSAHDLARWLLAGDDIQVLRLKLLTEVGGEIDIDASNHERVRAIRKMLKAQKADQ